MLRFDPFRELDSIAAGMFGSSSGSDRVPRFMPMDLYKVDDHYVLSADLPGVDPGSIDVDVDRGTLTLTAHRTAPSDGGVQWISSERFAGTYRRQIALGDGIDTERITASYDNGVLSVTIPLAERAKPRKIDISRSGAEQRSIEPHAT
ncbi:Hsp20/alpha crystallin family protein [Rhodococcus sp. BP-252]|uniref:Heat-shock protein Hsp20 n=1 Tax=Rhodococcoides kyotonense TaxID=398843 RepID=A0A177YMU9_9NOCA|nr:MULTISPECIES: Hsp20/alpha crystallin family protein [Rhodococcus]NIL77817.1 18 kDa heat shock protein [Rhodococcus sp. B10]MBY6414450.1 Hsp20/alpha crystallin family protein [Rhodococcus sp. BP-320]MBY6419167.1 Hsp20/alpha crystallin family protein [Rhodococcus sp. BP-321]MBY6424011.1 Hsp20/alpha crystallin family protein [Rhodococcus sp. BP-324]MBY6429278.1 Hsp20/alpha crystallin family protein [Rhodococcus sp. BP-323]